MSVARGPVGRRISVWGVTGAGKTTLSRELGARLGLAVIELDALRHRRGWDSTSYEELRPQLAARLDETSLASLVPDGPLCLAGAITLRLKESTS